MSIFIYLQEALRRILIIFAKLNPGIRYVQGMNEVLAPLFYVFRNDPDEGNAVSIFFGSDFELRIANIACSVPFLGNILFFIC